MRPISSSICFEMALFEIWCFFSGFCMYSWPRTSWYTHQRQRRRESPKKRQPRNAWSRVFCFASRMSFNWRISSNTWFTSFATLKNSLDPSLLFIPGVWVVLQLTIEFFISSLGVAIFKSLSLSWELSGGCSFCLSIFSMSCGSVHYF